MWGGCACRQVKGHNGWGHTGYPADVSNPAPADTLQKSPVSDAMFSLSAKVTSCFEKQENSE
jgi:hypothetical protein